MTLSAAPNPGRAGRKLHAVVRRYEDLNWPASVNQTILFRGTCAVAFVVVLTVHSKRPPGTVSDRYPGDQPVSNVQSDSIAEHRTEVRWNAGRDIVAGVLITVALVLPWNLSLGLGMPDGSTWLFVPLVVVSLMSWASLAISHLGRGAKRSVSAPAGDQGRARLALNAPYLLMVSAFVVFAYLQVVQFGGTGDVPTGVGPGVIVGAAGALLAAQPPPAGRPDRWQGAVRAIGFSAIGLATAAVLANLYWRTRFPLAALGDETYGGQNIAVIATALAYGAVAWITVLAGLRWLLPGRQSARLATVALGASTVLGTVLVWVLGVGRDIDAFHGIAQITSTAAVGFEGFLPWVVAAAILGPSALWTAWSALPTVDDWRDALRKCLALIALWSIGSAILRIFDIIVAISLDMPFSPYDSVALLAFDVVTAAAALWIRFNANGTALHSAVLSAAAGVLFVLTICRLAVGVGLAPRILYSGEPPGLQDAAYGNMLAQQITSTFDVVVCWLALAVAAIAVIVLQRGGLRTQAQRADPAAPAAPSTPVPAVASTTTAMPTVVGQSVAVPKIVRSTEPATQAVGKGDRKPKITRVLEESTQRFAAGTTYTGTGSTRPPPAER